MGEFVEVAKVLSAPLEKLIDAITNGIGTLYEPHKIRKLADAEAYRIGVLAEAVSQNTNLPIAYEKGEVEIDAKSFEELQKRAVARFGHQEIRRQINIESIADKAYDMLSQTDEVPDGNVSEDWIARFIFSSEDVSDEDIQNIWAKILADEIIHPKTYSLRTLEVLKNLSKDEAMLFNRSCPFVFEGSYYPRDGDYMEKSGLSLSDIVALDECGLIKNSHNFDKALLVTKERKPILKNNNYVIFGETAEDKNQIIRIPLYELSKVGRELFRAINNNEDNPVFIDYVKTMKKNNPNVQISLYQIDSNTGDYMPSDKL